jgi:hypothetical protein
MCCKTASTGKLLPDTVLSTVRKKDATCAAAAPLLRASLQRACERHRNKRLMQRMWSRNISCHTAAECGNHYHSVPATHLCRNEERS